MNPDGPIIAAAPDLALGSMMALTWIAPPVMITVFPPIPAQAYLDLKPPRWLRHPRVRRRSMYG